MGSGGHRGTGGRPSTSNPPFWKIIAMDDDAEWAAARQIMNAGWHEARTVGPIDHLALVKAIVAAAPARLSVTTPDTIVLVEAKAVIAEANNSLYGSQSYFLTTAKGEVAGAVGVVDPPDKYHLARPIERLKGDSRAAWRALRMLEEGHSNDALDTLRAALASTANPTGGCG